MHWCIWKQVRIRVAERRRRQQQKSQATLCAKITPHLTNTTFHQHLSSMCCFVMLLALYFLDLSRAYNHIKYFVSYVFPLIWIESLSELSHSTDLHCLRMSKSMITILCMDLRSIRITLWYGWVYLCFVGGIFGLSTTDKFVWEKTEISLFKWFSRRALPTHKPINRPNKM